MAFYTIDFEVANNEDWSQSFTLASDPATPIDLTGASFEMQVRGAGDATALDASTGNAQFVILDAANGLVSLNVPAAAMREIEPGLYRHDLIVRQSGQLFRVWSGRLYVRQGVTL